MFLERVRERKAVSDFRNPKRAPIRHGDQLTRTETLQLKSLVAS